VEVTEAKKEADKQLVSGLAGCDSLAKRDQQEIAESAKQRQQTRHNLDHCERERDITKTMLITQMNHMREANEKRFRRVRQLDGQELTPGRYV
jgi:hypothetical protein